MARPICILNGSNLNMLATREPEFCGREVLAAIERQCRSRAAAMDAAHRLVFPRQA